MRTPSRIVTVMPFSTFIVYAGAVPARSDACCVIVPFAPVSLAACCRLLHCYVRTKENYREEAGMRRLSICIPLLAAAACLQSPAAFAQAYPSKPVRVIATSSAGGISDIFIRVVGEELQKRWGQ